MSNTPHTFLLTLKMDDKIIATRAKDVVEYNDRVIYSLRLNQLMKEMMELVTGAFKERDVDTIFENRNRAERFHRGKNTTNRRV